MPQVLKARYEILESLGIKSGFGETFLAIDTDLPSRPKCIIKKFKTQLKDSYDPDTYQIVLQRFEREAAVLEKLGEKSDQIPDLYAYFDEEKEYYIVQEYIEGVTVGQRVLGDKPFTEEEAIRFLKSLLPVLIVAHSSGIIHRDIKPDNIILRKKDGVPVLIDFGAVKEIVSGQLDQYGHQVYSSIKIGTEGYIPLEQAAGKPVYSSDLYSLALTVIFALTGKPPQQLTNLTGKIAWENQAPTINQSTKNILNTAIQPNYQDRFPSAEAMLEEIEAHENKPLQEQQTSSRITGGYTVSSPSDNQSIIENPFIRKLPPQSQKNPTKVNPRRRSSQRGRQEKTIPWWLWGVIALSLIWLGWAGWVDWKRKQQVVVSSVSIPPPKPSPSVTKSRSPIPSPVKDVTPVIRASSSPIVAQSLPPDEKQISKLINNHISNYIAHKSYDEFREYRKIIWGDIDADGDQDFVVGYALKGLDNDIFIWHRIAAFTFEKGNYTCVAEVGVPGTGTDDFDLQQINNGKILAVKNSILYSKPLHIQYILSEKKLLDVSKNKSK
jgi:serine/threonine protein kinase, bacterial